MPRIIFGVDCNKVFLCGMRLNKNIKIFLNYFLGPVLFIWLSFSIYTQIKNQPNLSQSLSEIKNSLASTKGFNLLLCAILMVINWGLETVKWKIAVKGIQPVSFLTAFKAVLSGVSFSISTINRMGEYFGRVLYMKEGNRVSTAALTIICSMSQLITTLFFGWFGIFLIAGEPRRTLIPAFWENVLIGGTIIALVILTLFYFRLSILFRWIGSIPALAKYRHIFTAIQQLDATILWSLLSLSAVRYVVFILQYYLLFNLFGVDLNWWQVFWSVSVTFLIMAVLPNIALIELFQRNAVSLAIIGLLTKNQVGISLTTSTIWLINLVIPSVIGSLLILRVKIFKRQNETS